MQVLRLCCHFAKRYGVFAQEDIRLSTAGGTPALRSGSGCIRAWLQPRRHELKKLGLQPLKGHRKGIGFGIAEAMP